MVWSHHHLAYTVLKTVSVQRNFGTHRVYITQRCYFNHDSNFRVNASRYAINLTAVTDLGPT